MDEREHAAGRDDGLGGEPVGPAWLILERLHDLRSAMDGLDTRIGVLDGRVGHEVERLDAKIDRLDAKTTAEFERLDAKIDARFDTLAGRMATLQTWMVGLVVTTVVAFGGNLATILMRRA